MRRNGMSVCPASESAEVVWRVEPSTGDGSSHQEASMTIALHIDEDLDTEVHISGRDGEVTIYVPPGLLDGRAFASLGAALSRIDADAYSWETRA
jgi:hypothetical protein